MPLDPIRPNPGRRNVSKGASIPAPTKGWNTRDPLDGMDEGYAVILDNWFPQPGYCEVRKGSAEHATGIGSGVVETLFEYVSGSTRHLLAFGNSAVYNASVAGAVGAALDSGFTNNRWQGFTFNNYGLFFNGADTPRKYDGTTFNTTAWSGSGLTATDLIGGTAFKNRAYLIERNSASFWYGGLNAITGTVTEFDLSRVFARGGNLQAIGTMTIDGGQGPDDLIAFLMDTGAVIVYSGSDPGDASLWSLVGIFHIGAPIGRRPLVRYGSDLVVITGNGYVPLRGILSAGQAKPQLAISDVISPSVNEAVRSFGSLFGWEAVFYPNGTRLVVNVPLVENGQSQQHVMNTVTGAWCRFTGVNAMCWGLFNDELYYGGVDGVVYKADTTFADDGSNIQADGQTSYQYFGGRGLLKKFGMYRPVMSSEETLPVTMGLGVDFETAVPLFTASSITSSGAEWDVAEWDVDEWASGAVVRKAWQSANKQGYSASARVRTDTGAQSVKWFATDITYETGAFL